MNRWLLALAGVLAFGVGLFAAAAPGVVSLGPDRVVVWTVGLAALVGAYRELRRGLGTPRRSVEPPDPEVLPAVGSPGDDLTDVLRGFAGASRFYARPHRDGLRELAVAVIGRLDGVGEAEARAAVADGTWTDDRVVAAFLAADGRVAPLDARLGGLIPGRSSYGRRVGRAAAAIADRAGLERPARADRSPLGAVRGWRRERSEAVPSFDRFTRAEGRAALEPGPTGRWRSVGVVAFTCIGLGVLFSAPAVLLAAGVGLAVLAYARWTPPEHVEVAVERSVGTWRPSAGEVVPIEVRVTNEGDRPIPDLRIVDGVPEALEVVEGSPRRGTALRPGESARLEYAVEARRGRHAFQPTLVITRSPSGAVESGRLVEEPGTITCRPVFGAIDGGFALSRRGARYAGQVPTARGGEGIEFHATRPYRPGDPARRVDWNRWARTGELSVVEFREERSTTVVLVVDAREEAYVAPGSNEAHAVDRAATAAGRLATTLLGSSNRVGLAAMAPAERWVEPRGGRDHRDRVHEALSTDPAFASTPPTGRFDPRRWARRFDRRLSAGAEVVLLSPLVDPYPAGVIERLAASGHPAAAVSPDPTAVTTPVARLARLDRRLRLADLRDRGIRVVDWPWGDPLDLGLERTSRRVSA